MLRRDDDRQGYGRRGELVYFQTRFTHESAKALAGKKVQVGAIQQAAVLIIETPKQEVQAHIDVGDVRQGHDYCSIVAQISDEFPQNGSWIFKMLQDIAKDHDVVRLVERRQWFVEIQQQEFVAMIRRLFAQDRIGFYAGYLESLGTQSTGQIPMSGANIEQTPAISLTRELEDEGMAGIDIGLFALIG